MNQPDSAFWSDVQETFGRAIALPHEQRTAFVEEACAGRPRLRTEVDALLQSHDLASGFLAEPAIATLTAPATFVGRTVGAYRLTERIGSGAMGRVYRAERADGDFEQTVAVKLIDLRLDDAEALRRFASERQILASLNHPNIVRLLDGRIDATGQAYLVMEHVDGVSITRFCAHHRLSFARRIELLRQVAAAVHEAHEHGIVHRDLKPDNILVTPAGEVKVLDYGIAKLLTSAPGSDATLPGLPQPLTPNYASPEQLRGLPVTTAADVYALGVLLFEVLTGSRPYDTTGQPLDAMLRMVVDRDPPKPSTARLAGSVPYGARRLRGDLDAVVRRAMEKRPDRRYASTRELADDLARHLSGRPVVARDPSFAYLVTRLASRHRAAFVSTSLVAVAVVAALAVSLWHMREAVRERNRATARFNDLRHLANTLIFRIHDEVTPLAGSTPVRREIVAEALRYLERLAADPGADDGLRLELARGYHRVGNVQGAPAAANLGDRDGAMTSLRRAAALLQPTSGRDLPSDEARMEFARIHLSIASVANITGDRDAATAAAETALAQAERLGSTVRDDEVRRLLGSAYFQMASVRGAEGLPQWQKAGEVFESLLAERPDDRDRQRNVALVQKYIGSHFEQAGDYEAALRHHLAARALDERRLAAAPDDRVAQFDLAIDFGNVAYAHWQGGRLREAIEGYENSLRLRQRLSESDPADVLARGRVAFAHSRLTLLYEASDDLAAALAHAREAVAIGQTMAAVDPRHREVYLDALRGLGVVQRRAGRPGAACAAFRQALQVIRGTGEPQGRIATLGAALQEDVRSCASAVSPRSP